MNVSGEKHYGKRHMAWSLLIIIAVAATVAMILWYQTPKAASPNGQQQNVKTEPARPISIEANTLFVGDIYWGRYVNDWSMASPLKTAYPFSRLNEFNRDAYDAWIGNLECPTVPGFTQSSKQEDATLSFNCSPEYLPEAAKWFTAMSLANNHTDNRGALGFTQTKEQLDKNSIQYFGHYDPAVTDDVCEVVSLPVTVTYSDESTKQQKLPVALCGYNGVFKIPPAASIAAIQQYAAVMPVIAMPHMGAEYKSEPDSIRMNAYRAMIDAGADMVLGNHPHWVQSTESYNGKLIVYSMGNFIFDQQANKEVTRSAAINVVFSATTAKWSHIDAWLKVGESCASFKDSCLQTIAGEGLAELPIEYKYGVIGSNSAGKITKPASEVETAEILERLKWSQTMSQLRAPQASL